MKLVANSDRSLGEAILALKSAYAEKRYVRITVTTGRDRTLDQNALWWAMYQRISEVLGDGTAEDIAYYRAFCKLRCGVPILQVHSEEFRQKWHLIVLSNPALQSWEAQMRLMQDPMFGQDGFPVTRLFTTAWGAEYTESVNRVFTQQSVYFGDLLDGNQSKTKRLAAPAKNQRC